MNINKNQSLKDYNSFNVDHEANFFLKVDNKKELIDFLNHKKYKNESKFILGGGSNILFTKDFNGVILYNNIKGIKIIDEDDETIKLKVGSGENWDKLVSYCVEQKWYGIENLSLIPGSVGAAPIQNIGAYGVEIKKYIDKVNGINLINAKYETYDNKSCEFSYRDSIFKRELKNIFFITSIEIRLYKTPKFNLSYKDLKGLNEKKISILELRNTIIEIRNSKLPNPNKIGNAGSFFKNPIITKEKFNLLNNRFSDIKYYKTENQKYKIPAAWLIEKCGWKGYTDNIVGVYKDHALVIVNYKSESGETIKELSNKIKKDIKKTFSIELEVEVNIL